jgi:hypothetical protein
MSMMITEAGSLLCTTTQYKDMICCDITCYVIQNIKFSPSWLRLIWLQVQATAADVAHITHHSVNGMLHYYMFVIQQCARTDLSVWVRVYVRSCLWSWKELHWFITQWYKILENCNDMTVSLSCRKRLSLHFNCCKCSTVTRRKFIREAILSHEAHVR